MEGQAPPGLEIDINPRQQEREWIVQRVAVIALGILLVFILLGLFGRGGPLSAVEAEANGGATRIRYERFVRNHSPDKLELAALAHGDEVRVRLDGGYVKRIALRDVTPQPARVVAENDGLVFVFHARPGVELHAAFQFAPDALGPLTGWVQADGAPRQALAQFVFP